MSFFKRLGSLFTANQAPGFDNRSYWLWVRCNRCGEALSTRVDLLNDLSRDYDTGHYTVRKLIVGGGENRCFQRIEVELTFDKNKRLIDQSISGGQIIEAPGAEEEEEDEETASTDEETDINEAEDVSSQ